MLNALVLLACLAPGPFLDESPNVVGTGYGFTEGPTWLGDRFYFCDMRNDTLYSWSGVTGEAPVPALKPSGRAVGAATQKNELILVETAGRRLVRWNPAKPGEVKPVADAYEGKKLGGLNDVAVHKNGTIFATHADWFLSAAQLEFKHSGVIAVSPKGEVTLAADDIARPNGVCFSPDGKLAYVTEYSSGRILAFDVKDGKALTNQRVFADLNALAASKNMAGKGGADGIRTDRFGNIFSTGPEGIWAFKPNGEFLAHLPVRGTNLAFGGKDGKLMLITTGSRVLSIRTEQKRW